MTSFDRTKPYTPKFPDKNRVEEFEAKNRNKLKDARVSLAELKAYAFSMPNPLLLLNPLILRESLASSEIENIHTTLEDVLQNQIFPERERNDKDKKVLRHSDAAVWGYQKITKNSNPWPISTRLCIGIHSNLLPTYPEQFRDQQNRIKNKTTDETVYTPPKPNHVPDLIKKWENFVNNEESMDPLIKTIISHYFFEAVHPFSDGNGRTGRVLMVLQLIQDDLLKWPVLYISGYISRNKSEYLKNLRDITEEDNWEKYILFMLEGFHKQSQETNNMLISIMALFEETKEFVKKNAEKIYSADLVQYLFSNPYITATTLSEKLNVHRTTAMRYLKKLKEIEALEDQKVGKYRLFINHRLIDLMKREEQ